MVYGTALRMQITNRRVGDDDLITQRFEGFLTAAPLEVVPERGQPCEFTLRGGKVLALRVGLHRRCLQSLVDVGSAGPLVLAKGPLSAPIPRSQRPVSILTVAQPCANLSIAKERACYVRKPVVWAGNRGKTRRAQTRLIGSNLKCS